MAILASPTEESSCLQGSFSRANFKNLVSLPIFGLKLGTMPTVSFEMSAVEKCGRFPAAVSAGFSFGSANNGRFEPPPCPTVARDEALAEGGSIASGFLPLLSALVS